MNEFSLFVEHSNANSLSKEKNPRFFFKSAFFPLENSFFVNIMRFFQLSNEKNPMIKTNVMRLLDKEGIPYRAEFVEDVHDEDWSSLRTSELLGVPPEQIFKTLVLRGDLNRFLVCSIPSNDELDLKKVARASGDKKVELIHVKEIREITGYIRGGCSPMGMKKKFPTFFDETMILYDEIHINAGALDTMVVMNPNDLIRFADAKTADLVVFQL